MDRVGEPRQPAAGVRRGAAPDRAGDRGNPQLVRRDRRRRLPPRQQVAAPAARGRQPLRRLRADLQPHLAPLVRLARLAADVDALLEAWRIHDEKVAAEIHRIASCPARCAARPGRSSWRTCSLLAARRSWRSITSRTRGPSCPRARWRHERAFAAKRPRSTRRSARVPSPSEARQGSAGNWRFASAVVDRRAVRAPDCCSAGRVMTCDRSHEPR
jgi:hypothetical protein